jgi:hypothetical protein
MVLPLYGMLTSDQQVKVGTTERHFSVCPYIQLESGGGLFGFLGKVIPYIYHIIIIMYIYNNK